MHLTIRAGATRGRRKGSLRIKSADSVSPIHVSTVDRISGDDGTDPTDFKYARYEIFHCREQASLLLLSDEECLYAPEDLIRADVWK